MCVILFVSYINTYFQYDCLYCKRINNSNLNMPSAGASSWRDRREQLRAQRNKEGGAEASDDENDLEALSKYVKKGSHGNGNNHQRRSVVNHNQSSDDYVAHVSAAKRMKLEREEVLKSITGENVEGDDEGTMSQQQLERNAVAKGRKKLAAVGSNAAEANGEAASEGEENQSGNETEEGEDPNVAAQSLLEQAAKLRQSLTTAERATRARNDEETRILKEASKVQTNALQAASELAHGVIYKDSLPTTWTVPSHILKQGEAEWDKVRNNWHILVEGFDCPPPMRSFADMRLPPPILDFLQVRNIKRPTPIQMQGLPVALAGRDMVGIAFTGSGKTMTFSLPLVMAALEEEIRMPLVGGEGPVGIVLAPSRELVRQTYDLVESLCKAFADAGFPKIRSQLVIGGENARDQLQPFRDVGVHCVVATPGRLRDFLKKKSITLDICRYICLDEADRMLDLGFDEEVGEIMNHFKHQRQTLLFSATFPKKFQDFAKQTLIKPLVVNVGRAGAANLDVIQEVEYVKQEAKIVYLLECLQKTAPPVIIFCERKGDVDDIHEYLLLKGVEAVSIHGGKDQAERNEAIRLFKEGEKDVLIATDIAAKGLDFADIQHVVNFDMPSEIENYVHRIGRTGRCGKTGVATTFINKSCEETTLLDLKHLLKEAHQRIPPVLMIMEDPLENVEREDGTKGCSFCGGLGHSIVDCPKIDKDARRVTRKDALASGDGYGGDW
jgi:ATP-dependent RNA helicase DDX41